MMNRFTFKIFLIGCCGMAIWLLSMSASAQDGRLPGTERLGDARMLAMAGALRASSSNTSAVYLNPAAMSMAKVYHINLKYQYTGLDALHNGGVVLMDSVTSQTFAGGVSFDYVRSAKEYTDFESIDGKLAVSATIRDIFFFGTTVRYLRTAYDVESSSLGPNYTPALPRNDTVQAKGFTFDAGMALKAGDIISIGVVGYNLSNTGSVYAPLQLGGGVSALIKNMWLIEVDAVTDFTSYDETSLELQLGTEFILKQQFSFRGGFGHDFHFDVNSYGLGFGFTGKRLAVDLGFKQDIEFPKRVRIALGFRIFIG
ncbi:MAG: hypothetical protein JXX29_19355 [Deltaproteobacteria bacterium]|nr:hypothetical protein [Deltaproteobacteria bacterium]MBN2673846.1 hypothetical protein [Deltaproteobacteria bacterium]